MITFFFSSSMANSPMMAYHGVVVSFEEEEEAVVPFGEEGKENEALSRVTAPFIHSSDSNYVYSSPHPIGRRLPASKKGSFLAFRVDKMILFTTDGGEKSNY
ncbi:hypothetical protein CDAR_97701 [Caerostris darwini]|uniref:Uncharacterized protein n=1 Tax=Caerostris darwini TaxID=1538125 RepID=A0AAV4NFT9_9ARAC|nr:hypothetical protein CDAR_97701 [Caerostris darwini]